MERESFFKSRFERENRRVRPFFVIVRERGEDASFTYEKFVVVVGECRRR